MKLLISVACHFVTVIGGICFMFIYFLFLLFLALFDAVEHQDMDAVQNILETNGIDINR